MQVLLAFWWHFYLISDPAFLSGHQNHYIIMFTKMCCTVWIAEVQQIYYCILIFRLYKYVILLSSFRLLLCLKNLLTLWTFPFQLGLERDYFFVIWSSQGSIQSTLLWITHKAKKKRKRNPEWYRLCYYWSYMTLTTYSGLKSVFDDLKSNV